MIQLIICKIVIKRDSKVLSSIMLASLTLTIAVAKKKTFLNFFLKYLFFT